jgi:hypothetical protein
MGDAHNLKSAAEILARQSRPQRNSTWVPKKRDWRYATGIFQHEDFDDAPNMRSVWDTLDYHYQAGGQSESRRQRGSVGVASRGELGDIGSMEVLHTPNSTASTMSLGSSTGAAQCRTASKPMTQRRAWAQVKRFRPSEFVLGADREARYEVVSLTVRLRFTGKNKTRLREMREQPVPPATPPSMIYKNMTPPVSTPNTPATARTAQTIHTPHRLDSIESLHAFPLFKRRWVDETYDFKVDIVRVKLRSFGIKSEELGAHYHWYADAVPIDAIFPPGVPLSAKEIIAFYPHHVRWKGVMLRLTNNGYRGADLVGMQVSCSQISERSSTTTDKF